MQQVCGFKNCNNPRTPMAPGAEIKYMINNLPRIVLACTECAYKIMMAERGSWQINKHRELVPIPAKRSFLIT